MIDYDAIAKAISPQQLAEAIGAERTGAGWRCPLRDRHTHDDAKSSFSAFRDGGRTAGKCHGCGLGGSPVSLAAQVWGVELGEAALRLAELIGLSTADDGRRAEISSMYDYVDEDGEVLYQVVRFAPKDFRQRRPDGNGGWTWKLGDVRRVLYKLPQIIEAAAFDKLIHVVEGEKDVHAIEAAGGIATTNAGGSGKWRPEYSETLRGARVRIVADRDEKGYAHARRVAAALVGIAAEVEIVQAHDGKDAFDHLAAGYGLDDFEPLREDRFGALFDPVQIRFGRFLARPAPPREWILDDMLPARIVALLASMGGAGKSYLLYQLLISICTGIPFLGLRVETQGAVLYLAAEDDEDELHRRGLRIVEHYEALGEPVDRTALSGRLHIVSRVAADNLLTASHGDGEVRRTVLVDRLIETASRIPDLRLIALDPVSRFRGGRANHEEDATRFVEALEAIREGCGAAVLALAHISQSGIREGGGQEIVRGSTALVDGVRWAGTLQRLRRDEAKDFGVSEEEAVRYLRLEVPKNNYAPPFPGLWLRREAGGVFVPWKVEKTRSTTQLPKAEAEYVEIVARIQALLREKGPLRQRQEIRFTT